MPRSLQRFLSDNPLTAVLIAALMGVVLWTSVLRVRDLGGTDPLPVWQGAASAFMLVGSAISFALFPAISRRARRKHPERFRDDVDIVLLVRLAYAQVPFPLGIVAFMVYDVSWWVAALGVVETAALSAWLAVSVRRRPHADTAS